MKAAIDTNILIRLLTADNKGLLQKAESFISKHSTKEIFIAYGVILEAYFVLKTHYKWENPIILDAIEHVLNADEFSVENDTAIRLAIAKARKGQPFFDSVIGEIGATRNLKTYTFDKKLNKNSAFSVVT
jgi:predicted nucleic-acid-binding protein